MLSAENFGGAGEGRPLFPGTVRLGRLFGVNRHGTLTSPFLDDGTIFGENITRHEGWTWDFQWQKKHGWSAFGHWDKATDGWHMSYCRHCAPGTPGIRCSCGFYTFFRQPVAYMRLGDMAEQGCVEAIVEGKGRCVVGDKGARLGEMRIVALVPRRQHSVTALVLRNLWRDIVGMLTFKRFVWPAAMILWCLGWLINAIVSPADEVWANVLIIAMWVATLLLNLIIYSASSYVESRAYVTQEALEKLKERYPEIPMYKSWKEATEKHPLSDPKSFQMEEK